MTPYRVFVSYSHADRPLVERLVAVLTDVGMTPMWDRNLVPGAGFSNQIQTFITNSHVLLPVITPGSAQRLWLHQEIGFAMALGMPVLPVSVGHLPLGLIEGIHAIELRDDLADAPAKLSALSFDRLVNANPDRPAAYVCTEDNSRRALLLARYADDVWAIGWSGLVRQVASSTTFHIPDRGPGDPVWKRLFPATPDDRYLFEALRRERVALQRHAVQCGCRLIIDPVEHQERVYRRHGPDGARNRIELLMKFLRDDAVRDVVVAVNDDAERKGSITLVADWFLSEAVSSGESRVLRQAVFTRDIRTVQQYIDDFNHRMHDLLTARGWTEADSRARAIDYLQAYLDGSSHR